MSLPVIVIGAGGHAKVLVSVLKSLKLNILGMTDVSPARSSRMPEGVPFLGGDEAVFSYAPDSVELANGIGSIASLEKRKRVFEKFKKRGYSFVRAIHPSALLMEDIHLGEGVQIMAGVIVQPGCSIGDDSILNTRATVDHDCVIEEHVHIAPGAVLSGGVRIGAMTHIGTSATIIQGIRVGRDVVVGAGAVVVADVPAGVMALGVPARTREKRA